MSSPARRSSAVPSRSGGSRIHRTGVVRAANLRSTPTRPHLWVVPDTEATRRPKPTRRRTPFVLLLVALLVGTTLGLLVLNTAIAVDSLKATQLRSGNAQRVEDIQRLERRVVDGSTPAELAARAAAEGMVPAGSPGHLVIGPDGDSTVRGTPAPATAPPTAPPTAPRAPATSSTPAPPSTPAPSSTPTVD